MGLVLGWPWLINGAQGVQRMSQPSRGLEIEEVVKEAGLVRPAETSLRYVHDTGQRCMVSFAQTGILFIGT